MERATPAHSASDRGPRPWTGRARNLWARLVNLFRPGMTPAVPGLRPEEPAGPTTRVTVAPPPPPVASPPPLVVTTQPDTAPDTEALAVAETKPTEAPAVAETKATEAPEVPAAEPTVAPPMVSAADLEAAEAIVTAAAIARRVSAPTPLISVVAVIEAWTSSLSDALDSLRRQSYPSWELLVVDTSRPAQPPRLIDDGDGRIRVLTAPGSGDAAAHNRGLEVARGQLVTYLADGATMAPGWLAALAWAYGRWPGASLFLGQRLFVTVGTDVDAPPDLVALLGSGHGRLGPAESVGDLGASALRRERAEARFEEGRPIGPAERMAAFGAAGGAHRIPALATLTVAPA